MKSDENILKSSQYIYTIRNNISSKNINALLTQKGNPFSFFFKCKCFVLLLGTARPILGYECLPLNIQWKENGDILIL